MTIEERLERLEQAVLELAQTENRCPICGDQTRVETDECRDCALNRLAAEIREIPDDEFERACKDLLGGCGSG